MLSIGSSPTTARDFGTKPTVSRLFDLFHPVARLRLVTTTSKRDEPKGIRGAPRQQVDHIRSLAPVPSGPLLARSCVQEVRVHSPATTTAHIRDARRRIWGLGREFPVLTAGFTGCDSGGLARPDTSAQRTRTSPNGGCDTRMPRSNAPIVRAQCLELTLHRRTRHRRAGKGAALTHLPPSCWRTV